METEGAVTGKVTLEFPGKSLCEGFAETYSFDGQTRTSRGGRRVRALDRGSDSSQRGPPELHLWSVRRHAQGARTSTRLNARIRHAREARS